MNVNNPSAVRDAASTVSKKHGVVDLLINNAADDPGAWNTLDESTPDEAIQQMHSPYQVLSNQKKQMKCQYDNVADDGGWCGDDGGWGGNDKDWGDDGGWDDDGPIKGMAEEETIKDAEDVLAADPGRSVLPNFDDQKPEGAEPEA